MHTYADRAGLALYCRNEALPARLQSLVPDVPLAIASTPVALAALLREPRWRAVGIEVAALGDAGEDLLGRLSALFPGIPVIAIGRRRDARRIAPFVAAGCVHRFLPEPLRAAPTRRCVDTALGRGPAAGRRWRRADALRPGAAAAAAIAIALALALAAAWRAAPSPSPSRSPSASTSMPTIDASAARHALASTTGTAPRTASAPAAPIAPAGTLAPVPAAATQALPAERAIHPSRASEQPATLPDAERLQALGVALLDEAGRAADARRFADAESRLAQAELTLGADPRVAALRLRVQAERSRQAARRAVWADAAREWSRTREPQNLAESSPDQGAVQLQK